MGTGFIKCKVLDPMLQAHYGEEAFYTKTKADELSSLGLVEVIVEEGKEHSTTLTGTNEASIVRKPSSPPGSAPVYLTRGAGFREDSAGFRVAWVQDYSKVGGAELSNYEVVRVGEQLGFDIIGVTPSLFDVRILQSADILVINNLFEFSGAQLTVIRELLHEKRVPYVKYEHDYRELRRLNIARALFRDSLLNVFISPMHRKVYAEALGWEAMSEAIVLPLAMNPAQYHPNKSVERAPGLTLVPSVRKLAPDALMKYLNEHPDRNLLLVGQCTEALPPARVEYLNKVPSKEMAKLYTRCEFMLHQPLQKWAGDRVFFEAMLCGCECIVNENVGHASWLPVLEEEGKSKKDIVAWLKDAPAAFWRAVREVLG